MSSSREHSSTETRRRSISASPSSSMFIANELFASLANGYRATSPSSVNILNEIKSEEKILVDTFVPPVLPVLNTIYEAHKEHVDFSNFIFVCGQHNLNTTTSLLQQFINLGAQKENIFVVGKSYSNNEKVKEWLHKNTTHRPTQDQEELGDFIGCYETDINLLWEQAKERIIRIKNMQQSIQGIIILDDGGHVLSKVPTYVRQKCPHIVGIEQTSSGIATTKTKHFPTIMVASSAVKNEIEPAMVADIVADKIKEHITKITSSDFIKQHTNTNQSVNLSHFQTSLENKDKIVFGIVGLGHIGLAVFQQLQAMGYKRFTLLEKDQNKRNEAIALAKADLEIVPVTELGALVCGSDIIIGCTGTDITAESLQAFKAITTPRILISCSSKDTEFLTLLKYIGESTEYRSSNATNVLDDIIFKNGFRSPIMILRGGFPINFDNSERSVKECDIELIRALKFEAVLQAYQMISDWEITPKHISNQSYMLDAHRQLNALRLWISLDRPSKKEYYLAHQKRFSIQYIQQHSSNAIYTNLVRSNSINTTVNTNGTNSATNSPQLRPFNSANNSPAVLRRPSTALSDNNDDSALPTPQFEDKENERRSSFTL